MRFKKVTIGEVCDLGDGAHSKVKRQESGIPYLTSKNIKKGYLDLAKIDYISEEDYLKLFSPTDKSVKDLRTGDILVGIIGTFGNVYLYKNGDKFGISSSIGILRPKKEMILPEFLYFQVKSELFSRTVEMIKGGSVQGYTNIPTLKTIPIYLPSLYIQQKIVEILSVLEEKINTNLLIISNLEKLSQELFNRWFIDFEFPNEQGLPYRSSGGEMVESELGEIPKEWKTDNLNEIANVIYGAAFSSKKFNENKIGLPLIRIRDLKTGNPMYYTDEEHKKATVVETGDLLIGMDAEFTPTIWKGVKSYLNQRVCKVEPNKSYVHPMYLFFILQPYMKFLENSKVGTTVIHLSKSDIDKLILIIPTEKCLNEFSQIVDPLYKKLILLYKENRNLVTLRDSLLPKLLSGEIEIPDESVVES